MQSMAVFPSTDTQQIITHNWNRVQQQVAEACQRAGRSPSEVKIVGVAKYVGPEFTAQLVSAGCTRIGENRPQSLWQKREWFDQHASSPGPAVQWHLIGHLQRNKVKRTLPLVDMIQSVDSLRLAKEISDVAVVLKNEAHILLDVNLTQDRTKTGFDVDQLRRELPEILKLPNLRLCGLMAMSSLEADPATVRKEFAAVRDLRDQLTVEYGSQISLNELSMGMSGDYQQAIAEGSTCVRIGSNLWNGILP
jgi:pyridoxal phosphate enzyme (YggS family)